MSEDERKEIEKIKKKKKKKKGMILKIKEKN